MGAVVLAVLASPAPILADNASVVWLFDNLERIGGHPVTVVGDPAVIDTPNGKAIEFDGVDDGIFLDVHPLAAMEQFTVEIVFRPYSDGASEQRFFHMQEDGHDSRVMFETRLVDGDRWFLDTFIKSGDSRVTLYAQEHLHDIGPWFHAAIVVSKGSFSHFINGRLEMSGELIVRPPQPGRTSVGVRINEVHWFRGAISKARFTPRPLSPPEFLAVPGQADLPRRSTGRRPVF